MRRRNRRPDPLGLLSLTTPTLAALCGCAGPAPAPLSRPEPPPAAAPATLPAALPSTRPIASPGEVRGVGNFARVAPGLYRGSQPTAEGFAELKKLGVRTVVNLRFLHGDRDLLRGTGLRYAHIHALPWAPGDGDAAAFLKLLQDPSNYPVFVHCQHGADRTGYLVAVYRVVEQGWAMGDAVREMHAFGSHPVWFQVAAYLRHFRAEGLRALVAGVRAPRVDTIQ